MTVPNVTMAWCQRTAVCAWCEKPITAGEPEVNVFFWNKGFDGNRSLNVKKHYHPDCWVSQGLDYLRRNPYSPYVRKRARQDLSEEQKRKRFLLTRRYHKILQSKKALGDSLEDMSETIRLDMKITELMLEMNDVGGVPKKWLERL